MTEQNASKENIVSAEKPVMPVIYIAQYDGKPYPSALKYEAEIRRFKPMIEKLLEANPGMTEAEAYLFIRNSASSINTYSIKD